MLQIVNGQTSAEPLGDAGDLSSYIRSAKNNKMEYLVYDCIVWVKEVLEVQGEIIEAG